MSSCKSNGIFNYHCYQIEFFTNIPSFLNIRLHLRAICNSMAKVYQILIGLLVSEYETKYEV